MHPDPMRPNTIPPLDRHVQKDCLIKISMKDRITGLRVRVDSTPLRWLYNNFERILYVETLTVGYAETASDPAAACPVCFKRYKKTG